MPDRLPLSGRSGLYVALFPDRVKIGTAGRLRARLRQHLASGMVEATAWPTPLYDPCGASFFGREQVEREALYLAAVIGTRIGGSESFAGLPYLHAIAIVDALLMAHGVRDVQHDVDMTVLAQQYTPTGFVRYAS